MKSIIKLELTEKEAEAIKTAFDELSNSGDWTFHYTDDEVDDVFNSMETVKEKIRKASAPKVMKNVNR